MNLKQIIGKRIREERKKKNLTMEKLAESVALSEKFIGTVERGESNLSVENLLKIADKLEVTVDSLLGRDICKATSRSELMNALIYDLDDYGFNFVYEVSKSVKNQLSNKNITEN